MPRFFSACLPCCCGEPPAIKAAPCNDRSPTYDQVAELAADVRSRLMGLEIAANRIEAGMVGTRQVIDEMKRKVRGKPDLGLEPAPPVSMPGAMPTYPRIGPSRAQMRRLLPVEEEEARRASAESQRSSRESGKESNDSANFSLESSNEGRTDGLRTIDEDRI